MTIWNRVFLFGKSQWHKSRESLLIRIPNPNSLRRTWLHRSFGERIFHSDLWVPTRSSVAMGLAIGWFFGMLPVFGLQIALSLVFGLFFRGHFPTAVLGTFISNPVTTPGILVLQYGLGKWLCREMHIETLPAFVPWPHIMHHGLPLGVGAVATAVIFSMVGYIGVWLLWGTQPGSVLPEGNGKV